MIFISAETGSAITASCLGFNHSLHQPAFSTGLPFVGYKSKKKQQTIYVKGKELINLLYE